jgi:ketosteroid isomerase-like protein
MTDTHATGPQSAVTALQQLDVIIDSAVSARDAATLGSVLADDFVYTHSNGRSKSKPDFIAAIAGREQPPRRVLSEIEAELHGDVAVTRGNLDIEYADERPNLYMRYVRVYRLTNHHWLPISHRTVYATDRKPA